MLDAKPEESFDSHSFVSSFATAKNNSQKTPVAVQELQVPRVGEAVRLKLPSKKESQNRLSQSINPMSINNLRRASVAVDLSEFNRRHSVVSTSSLGQKDFKRSKTLAISADESSASQCSAREENFPQQIQQIEKVLQSSNKPTHYKSFQEIEEEL